MLCIVLLSYHNIATQKGTEYMTPELEQLFKSILRFTSIASMPQKEDSGGQEAYNEAVTEYFRAKDQLITTMKAIEAKP